MPYTIGKSKGERVRDRDDIAAAMREHGDTVLRVCTLYLRERADREDVYQDTFLRYAKSDRVFNGSEHVKAWLIRVATNLCKDLLKSAARRTTESLDNLDEERLAELGMEDPPAEDEESIGQLDVLRALAKLDEKYRVVLYLKYYEQYTAAQIGAMLGIPENTVYTNLARGRKLLKGVLTYGN